MSSVTQRSRKMRGFCFVVGSLICRLLGAAATHERTMDVIVVGAGYAGLAATHALLDGGLDAVVLLR